jgi:glycerophosphoryl diester phosphodiesterase
VALGERLNRGILLTVVYAHRGSTGPARENTIEAFAAARRRLADGVELDVRRCADGTLVVHHDAVVPGAGSIDSLRPSDLPGWVPTLHDALAACTDLLVNVEVKSETEGPGHDPLERCAVTAARMCAKGGPGFGLATTVMSSFSLAALQAAQDEAPELQLGWLCGAEAVFDLPARLERAVGHGFAAIHPFHMLIDPGFVHEAHRAGLAVRAWTVDDPERIAGLASMGTDAVVTNDVPAALRALRRRVGEDRPPSGTISP